MPLEERHQRTSTIMRCVHKLVVFKAIVFVTMSILSLQEFDYVFDIELDEGGPSMRKLKLPYNKNSKIYLY